MGAVGARSAAGVLGSPYRSLLRPLLEYIDKIHARGDDQMVTVVLPESCRAGGGGTCCTTRPRCS